MYLERAKRKRSMGATGLDGPRSVERGGEIRVAVIGSGVVGSSVGWHLTRRGAEVVMIDCESPGAGDTNWSFSWLNASNQTETRAYFDFNFAAMAAYRELLTDLGSDDWWHPTGHLR
jgi:glycine/D-amino acid oxidase-like deaminating enzyme